MGDSTSDLNMQHPKPPRQNFQNEVIVKPKLPEDSWIKAQTFSNIVALKTLKKMLVENVSINKELPVTSEEANNDQEIVNQKKEELDQLQGKCAYLERYEASIDNAFEEVFRNSSLDLNKLLKHAESLRNSGQQNDDKYPKEIADKNEEIDNLVNENKNLFDQIDEITRENQKLEILLQLKEKEYIESLLQRK